MIKVNQHALINLVYSYMGTKVFNIQPVLFHQCYLCHLLWFKKQSFTLVWKPNPPLLSRLCTFALVLMQWVSCRLYPRSLALNVHLFTWSVKSDSCYNVPWLCSARAIWSRNFGAADHAFAQVRPRFFYLGKQSGGVVRLTAKPRYLLLLHRGEKKSNTVTALACTIIKYLHRELQLFLC